MTVPELYKLLCDAGVEIHIDTLYKARMGGFARKLALICEDVTGIPRERWVFPEKFGSPWDLPKNVEMRYRNLVNKNIEVTSFCEE
jgi:hypothetical protein